MAEVDKWRAFEYLDVVYDLSHLNTHIAKYIDERNPEKPICYHFHVTYSFHCFTSKEIDDSDSSVKEQLIYSAPKESRFFNIIRYELSKHLPSIISSLHNNTLVFHAGYNRFATVKLKDSEGNEVEYFVVFNTFREKRKLRLHVESAYPLKEKLGRVNKINFWSIAHKTLHK
jgi:hypothetical protein